MSVAGGDADHGVAEAFADDGVAGHGVAGHGVAGHGVAGHGVAGHGAGAVAGCEGVKRCANYSPARRPAIRAL